MSRRTPRPHPFSSVPPLDPSPAKRRAAGELVSKMAALESAGHHPLAKQARNELCEKAAALGLRYACVTVTEEPIPDPALDALPPAEYDRIEAISRAMYTHPEKQVAELERLVEKHPHIPMLRNHLAGAVEAAGDSERAGKIIEETARLFPRYLFAFCNRVMSLISKGRIEEARAMMETGPRGPVLTLPDFDPTREVFHVSEAASHAAATGRYLLATGRREAAQVQLNLLKRTAPQSAQYQHLKAAMEASDVRSAVVDALRRIMADGELRAQRRAAREAKKAAAGTAKPRVKKSKAPSEVEGTPKKGRAARGPATPPAPGQGPLGG